MISMNDYILSAGGIGLLIAGVILIGSIVTYPFFWFVNTQIELKQHLDRESKSVVLNGFFSRQRKNEGIEMTSIRVYVDPDSVNFVTAEGGWWKGQFKKEELIFDAENLSLTDLHVHKAEEKQ